MRQGHVSSALRPPLLNPQHLAVGHRRGTWSLPIMAGSMKFPADCYVGCAACISHIHCNFQWSESAHKAPHAMWIILNLSTGSGLTWPQYFFSSSLLLDSVLLLLPPLCFCLLLKPWGHFSQTPSTSRLSPDLVGAPRKFNSSCPFHQWRSVSFSLLHLIVSNTSPQIPNKIVMLLEWTV